MSANFGVTGLPDTYRPSTVHLSRVRLGHTGVDSPHRIHAIARGRRRTRDPEALRRRIFWIDQDMGRRPAALMDTILTRDRQAFGVNQHRGEIDSLLGSLVRMGMREAQGLEANLRLSNSRVQFGSA